MPTISIYIRKEDYPLWAKIQSPSEWLHRKLLEEKAFKAKEPVIDDDWIDPA
jgi:hypothetical protein